MMWLATWLATTTDLFVLAGHVFTSTLSKYSKPTECIVLPLSLYLPTYLRLATLYFVYILYIHLYFSWIFFRGKTTIHVLLVSNVCHTCPRFYCGGPGSIRAGDVFLLRHSTSRFHSDMTHSKTPKTTKQQKLSFLLICALRRVSQVARKVLENKNSPEKFTDRGTKNLLSLLFRFLSRVGQLLR